MSFLVERLLKENVDPNQGDEDGLTALHQSCIDDFEDLVKGIYQNHFNSRAYPEFKTVPNLSSY